MLKIDNALLEEVGLAGLPASEKNSFLKHIYETLEMRVGIRLADQMTNQQLDEFEKYFEAKDDAGAFKWLETNFPNYKEIVQQEFDKLKGEVAQSAPQILAASQDKANAAGQPPAVQAAPQQPPAPQASQQPYQPQTPPAGQPAAAPQPSVQDQTPQAPPAPYSPPSVPPSQPAQQPGPTAPPPGYVPGQDGPQVPPASPQPPQQPQSPPSQYPPQQPPAGPGSS